MSLVSISTAAKLVHRNRTTLYRDIDKGRLSKTVSPGGETKIETSELLRTYGHLYPNDDDGRAPDGWMAEEQVKIAILEEKNHSLERVIAVEAELRKIKDQLTNELRTRLAEKEKLIKILESKLLFLEYENQLKAESESMKKHWWRRPWAKKQNAEAGLL